MPLDGALLAILVMCAGMAAVNGANDVSKGVATLAGAGVTRYRTAIAWGVAATLVGSSLSLAVASGISTLFSKGIVSVSPQPAFTLAVLSGAAAWVGLATLARLPVSTTHALTGALIGAGLLLAPGSVLWGSIALKVAIPLLLSAAVSYAISATLARVTRAAPQCVCVEVRASESVTSSAKRSPVPTSTVAISMAHVVNPQVSLIATSRERCPVHDTGVTRFGINVNGAHWVSSGATCLARGLNDTPKIWAVGAFALVPAHLAAGQLLATVAVAMAIGGIVAGIRVARRLGEHI
ncbi:MAG: inorganic phosphate transporter, partial [Candidatus Dormibacteria bacterium]